VALFGVIQGVAAFGAGCDQRGDGVICHVVSSL
jgi:hypothetical protein